MELFADITWLIGLAIGIPILGLAVYCGSWSVMYRIYGAQARLARQTFSVLIAVVVAAAFLLEGILVLGAS